VVTAVGDKSLSIRLDGELLYKIQYVSRYDGRSANGEIVYLIRQYVRRFEDEHGAIDLNDSL
jgi:hypothetical protein